MKYAEHRFWSITHGQKVARLSIADEHGQEFFMIVPTPDRGWADERADLLQTIATAIEMGLAPGEVRVHVDA